MTDIDFTTSKVQNRSFTAVPNRLCIYEDNDSYWYIGIFDTNFFFNKDSAIGESVKTKSQEELSIYLDSLIIENSFPGEVVRSIKHKVETERDKGFREGVKSIQYKIKELLSI